MTSRRCFIQAYALLISALSLFVKPSVFSRWTATLKVHLNLILVAGRSCAFRMSQRAQS